MKPGIHYIYLALLSASSVLAQPPETNPLKAAQKVIGYIKSRQSFQLEDAVVKSVANLQIIDFDGLFQGNSNKKVYAAAVAKSEKKNNVAFGISASAPVKLWVNKQLVYERNDSVNFFSEIAYSVFTFNDTLSLDLNAGDNIFIVSPGSSLKAAVFIKELNQPEKAPLIRFVSEGSENKNAACCWKFFPPLNGNADEAKSIDEISMRNGLAAFEVKEPSVITVRKLKLHNESVFRKESYNEWTYPNGILYSSIFNYARLFDTAYMKTVSDYCAFIFENSQLFKEQYYKKHDLRTSNYRMFRVSMLDDAGSPPLPFADMAIYLKGKSPYDSLLERMADFIMTKQYRLPDSTFCRPEPDKWTVWADDMFMSVPFLLRMGALKGENKYYDEAARQVINISGRIRDEKTGLYRHGWFSFLNEKSPVCWGRANGWAVWAESEAVELLPKNHKEYKKVTEVFKKHLAGVLPFQGEGFMWRQVMDDASSFEETSCSAMFVIGICRGIRNGIIDKSEAARAYGAWKAIEKKIDSKGIVYDICCGTGIGNKAGFYEKRDRYPNDPRGLGAVITAAIEIEKLTNYLKQN